MRRALAYCITALAAYGATLLAVAPATWLADLLDEATGHRVHFREASGTIWDGSARLVARTPEQLIDLGTVRWTARPAIALPPSVRAELQLPHTGNPVRMDISLASVGLGPISLQFPASMLAVLAPALDSFGPEGTLHVRSESLRVEHAAYFGLAEVEWRHAALKSQPGVPLGSHVARLRGGGERVDIELGTLEGALWLTGKATWRPNGAFEITGTAEPRQPEIVPFLRAVCASYEGRTCPFSYRRGPS